METFIVDAVSMTELLEAAIQNEQLKAENARLKKQLIEQEDFFISEAGLEIARLNVKLMKQEDISNLLLLMVISFMIREREACDE